MISVDILGNVVGGIPIQSNTLTLSVHARNVQCTTITGPIDRAFAVRMALHADACSDVESVGECDRPYEHYPFEDYDAQHGAYLQRLALLHSEHMFFYERGLLWNEDFMSESVDDVYHKNMYSMSWFYEGCYPFDTWEGNYEHWLYDQVLLAMIDGEHVVSP